MKQDKNCIRCQKEVLPNDNHIKLEEYNNGELKNIRYIHNSCWNEILKTKNLAEQTMGMANEAMGYLRGLGIKPTKVVKV